MEVMIPVVNLDLNQSGKLDGKSGNVIDPCWEFYLLLILKNYLARLPESVED